MFNTNSDYAINKLDPNAIVCRSTTGQLLRITREDFASDEEFEKWKAWSDADYHESELRDRAHDDRCCQMPLASIRTETDYYDWLNKEFEITDMAECTEFIERIRDYLTETQFSRLWQRFAEKRELSDIADDEGVTIAAVANSIDRAIKRLKSLKRCGRL